MSRFAFIKALKDAVGAEVNIDNVNAQQICLAAVYSSQDRGLDKTEILDWAQGGVKDGAFRGPAPTLKTIQNSLGKLAAPDMAKIVKIDGTKRYVMAPPPPPPPPPPATTDYDMVNHCDNDDDVAAMSTSSGSSTSSSRVQTAVDEIAEGIASIVMDDSTKGAARLVGALSDVARQHSNDDHESLVIRLVDVLDQFVDANADKYSTCPAKDLAEFKTRHGLGGDSEKFWNIRDIFNKSVKSHTWIVDEKRHSKFPPRNERLQLYSHVQQAGTQLLLKAATELCNFGMPGSAKEQTYYDYKFVIPGTNETLYVTDMRSISQTFLNSEDGTSRLFASVSTQYERAEYHEHYKRKFEDMMKVECPDTFSHARLGRFGGTFRHPLSLMGCRKATGDEIDLFLLDPDAVFQAHVDNETQYTIRDVMEDTIGKNMVVRDKTETGSYGVASKEERKWTCRGSDTMARKFASFVVPCSEADGFFEELKYLRSDGTNAGIVLKVWAFYRT